MKNQQRCPDFITFCKICSALCARGFFLQTNACLSTYVSSYFRVRDCGFSGTRRSYVISNIKYHTTHWNYSNLAFYNKLKIGIAWYTCSEIKGYIKIYSLNYNNTIFYIYLLPDIPSKECTYLFYTLFLFLP